MDNDRSELRWGVEQRLEFIEFRLFWEGHVNRSDLMDQFGVSVNQASTDLNRYIGFAPDNIVYDKSARTYVRGPGFKPHFLEPDASRYLAQLRSVADGILDREDSWIADLPPYASAPTPVRGVNPATLRSVVGAIRGSQAIEVKYQSLSSPEPRWRWIVPHAIAFDGPCDCHACILAKGTRGWENPIPHPPWVDLAIGVPFGVASNDIVHVTQQSFAHSL